MTKEILADRINQLINVSKQLLFWSVKLKELHDKNIPTDPMKSNEYKTSEISMLLRFLHCTFYDDVISNLNTLTNKVQTDPNKKELSIYELIEFETNQNIKDEILTSAKNYRAKLEEINLHKWRNKLSDHKDIEKSGDPEIMYLNFIKEDILTFSIDLLNEIDSFVKNKYDVPYNNSFDSLYDNGFNKMLMLFKKELDIYL